MNSEIAIILAKHGIELLPPTKPMANYVPVETVLLEEGELNGGMPRFLAFVSGQPPIRKDRSLVKGKLGENMSVEEGQEAARLAGISMLSVLKYAVGSLDRVRVIKLLGMVNSTPDFTDHPSVINGCSDLMTQIFGEYGKHARSAIGVASLPGGIAVEIEGIFEFSW